MKPLYQWLIVSSLSLSPLLSFADSHELKTTTVTLKTIPALQYLDGHIEVVNQSTLSAQTSGVIESLNYDVDDFVEGGKVVATIRATNQKAGLQQAKAGVSEAEAGAHQARANLGQAKARVAEAQAGLSQAQAEEQRAIASSEQAKAGAAQARASLHEAHAALREAQAVLKNTQIELNRVTDIYSKRLIPRSEYDRAKTDVETAQARVSSAHARVSSGEAQSQSAQARFESSRAQIGSARSAIKAAKARVGSAKAALSAARANVDASKALRAAANAKVAQADETLDYTTVVAPYSGIVTERHVEMGEIVQPGKPIMTGISLEQMRVSVEVPQRLITQVRQHKQAFVYLDGSQTSLDVEKMTIFPYADPKTNAFRIRIDLTKGLDNLFPGMFVKVALVMGEDETLSIPQSAVAIRSEVTGVYVLDDQGIPHLRQIRLGRAINNKQVRVLSGLSEGETIALDPTHAVMTLKKHLAGANDHE